MTNHSESQCYFIQLQIDSYLDGDLSEAQQDVFMTHVHDCAACATELHYARSVQDSLLDMPLLDCEEQTLEPAYRLTREPVSASRGAWLQWLGQLTPAWRFALPVAALALAVILPPLLQTDSSEPVIAGTDVPGDAEYSPEEVVAALRDLNLAIEYLNEVSQRTEVMIGDRFLVTPLRESLNASFEEVLDEEDEALNNGPI